MKNDVLHQNTEDLSRPNDVLESNALLLLLKSQSAANGELKPPESNGFKYHGIQDGFNHMATKIEEIYSERQNEYSD